MANKKLNILVTGGAGYIGSHLVKMLLDSNFSVVSIDKNESLNQKYNKNCVFINGDVGDKNLVEKILEKYKIYLVMHLAALIRVDESIEKPDIYFKNNFLAGINLLEAMREAGVKKIIFASSAAVYGFSKKNLISENDPKKPSSVYGLTRLIFEEVLKYYNEVHNFSSVSFRIFNASGAELSGQLKELHKPETHIIPRILHLANKNKAIEIYGKNYKTPDGTCLRDFVHVNDISRAFLLAIPKTNKKICEVFNIGFGKGYSVKEVADKCFFLLSKDPKIIFKEPRQGDPPILVADIKKIKKFLNWRPKYNLEEIILHTIKSQGNL